MFSVQPDSYSDGQRRKQTGIYGNNYADDLQIIDLPYSFKSDIEVGRKGKKTSGKHDSDTTRGQMVFDDELVVQPHQLRHNKYGWCIPNGRGSTPPADQLIRLPYGVINKCLKKTIGLN